jgi:hypothetical protein
MHTQTSLLSLAISETSSDKEAMDTSIHHCFHIIMVLLPSILFSISTTITMEELIVKVVQLFVVVGAHFLLCCLILELFGLYVANVIES